MRACLRAHARVSQIKEQIDERTNVGNSKQTSKDATARTTQAGSCARAHARTHARAHDYAQNAAILTGTRLRTRLRARTIACMGLSHLPVVAQTNKHPPTQTYAERARVPGVLADGVLVVIAYAYGPSTMAGVLGVLRCGYSAPAMAGILGVLRCGYSAPAMSGVVGGSVVWCSLRAWAANKQRRGYSEYSPAECWEYSPTAMVPGHGRRGPVQPAGDVWRASGAAAATDRHAQSERPVSEQAGEDRRRAGALHACCECSHAGCVLCAKTRNVQHNVQHTAHNMHRRHSAGAWHGASCVAAGGRCVLYVRRETCSIRRALYTAARNIQHRTCAHDTIRRATCSMKHAAYSAQPTQ